MPKTLEEMGLTKFEITTEIILEPEDFDSIQADPETSAKIAEAIADVLGLKGRFRVNPYQWNYSTQLNSDFTKS